MGHVNHLLIVRAESHEDAQSEADSYIGDWGNDNNWRSIEGSFCVDDGSLVKGDDPATHDGYLEIPTMIKSFEDDFNAEPEPPLSFIKQEDGTYILSVNKDDPTFTWYDIEKYARKMYEWTHNRERCHRFDIKSIEIFSGCYDEYGVTQVLHDEKENLKTYAVLLDMHV